MVQSIDNTMKPVYSAVNIHITKPEVNAKNSNQTTVVNDNGVYNSVKIDIDNPVVNTEPQKIYDYPVNDEIVTYDMLPIGNNYVRPALPVTTAYYSESIFLPAADVKSVDNNDALKPETEENSAIAVPVPNYTDIEPEKADAESKEEAAPDVAFKAAPEAPQKKTLEIVPSVEIKPDVDISDVVSKLEDADFDVQAKQMEEIAKASIENPDKAVPYIVKDIFAALIDIVNKDTTKLLPPSQEQVEARRKIISNFIAAEIAKQNNQPLRQLPFNLTEKEMDLANQISPMEQGERNKEYAMYTIAILAKVYIDEVNKETGDVVPFTDVPGVSDIVNSLRHSDNPSVKASAIDALRHIQRPEYKDELSAIFQIAARDNHPIVAETASRTLEYINRQQ